mgnify:CR=1 FL=1
MPYMPNYLYPYLSGESAGIPKNSGKYSVNIAVENHQKVTDNIRLEIETAFYNYSQAIDKVKLTESSLSKAADNERMAMDKYKEGNISIVEVINAQLYHQDAKVNYIQSKLNAQDCKKRIGQSGRPNRHHNSIIISYEKKTEKHQAVFMGCIFYSPE